MKVPRQPSAPITPRLRPDPASSEAARTIAFEAAGPTERLDRFLADQLPLSRTQAGRLIAEGAVRVNGAAARPSRTLVRGDRVEVILPGGGGPPRHIVPRSIPLAVIHEDDAMLVIDKPAGLVVHPAPGHWDDTLVNALAARRISLAGGDPVRPGIVHRLDRDTSGLMVVAKTDVAHRRLARAIGLRRVERDYAALVWGHLPDTLEIDAPIARHPRDRKRMAAVATGRPAVTLVTRVGRFALTDLVKARLVTGRTHQIRVHLAHVGHPVVGDPVYGGGGSRRVTGADRPRGEALERVVPRQALHAARLGLAHPITREWLEFRSEWPSDIRPGVATAADDSGLLARSDVLEYLGFFQ